MPLAAGKKFAELAGRRRRPQKQITQPVFLPCAQGGINAVSSATELQPQDALVLINMVPSQYGVRVRKGYREWCPPVPAGSGIRTLVPFKHPSNASVLDRLFAFTSDGIYDVTSAGVAPTKKFDFTVKAGNAGWASWQNYVTIAGSYLLAADEENGYLLYTASTDTWTVGSISGGITPDKVEFVTVWKNRVWVIERNSGRGWYLPVGQISGNAASFEFGNKFKYGGLLKSLHNWTLDGGEGVDDYLVALSAAGDMLVYKGTDPATAPSNFNMNGWWYIGDMMEGRRQADDMGGELLIITSYGVIQASKLIAGMPLTDAQASISFKINPRLAGLINRGVVQRGWQIVLSPIDQMILLLTPKELSQPYTQFCYNTQTRAWSQFVGVPINTASVFHRELYLGDLDNRIYVFAGAVDHVMLEDDGETAQPIEWESLTSFQGYNQPARFKRVQFLRPMFIGQATPLYTTQARYDFNLSQPPGSPPYTPPTSGAWDTSIWDIAFWGGSYIVDQPPIGGDGLGRYVAVYMRGRSGAETTHIGTDVMFDMGGIL